MPTQPDITLDCTDRTDMLTVIRNINRGWANGWTPLASILRGGHDCVAFVPGWGYVEELTWTDLAEVLGVTLADQYVAAFPEYPISAASFACDNLDMDVPWTDDNGRLRWAVGIPD